MQKFVSGDQTECTFSTEIVNVRLIILILHKLTKWVFSWRSSLNFTIDFISKVEIGGGVVRKRRFFYREL